MVRSLPEELGYPLEMLRSNYSLGTLLDSLGCMSSLRKLILVSCSELKSLPDSLGRNVSLRGDSSTETRRPAAGHSSQLALTEGFGLHVHDCPFVSDSELQELGWIHSDEKYVREGNDLMFDRCFGLSYQRKCPGEDRAPSSHSLN